MSRTLSSALSQYLYANAAPVIGYPVTMAAWCKTGDTGANQDVLWLGDRDSSAQALKLGLYGVDAGDPVRVWAVNGTPASAATTSGFAANAWLHAAAVFASATSRAVYLNGASKGASTTDRAFPTGADRIALGCEADSAMRYYVNGAIAEAAVWDVALSDAEIAALAAGENPQSVQPGHLVFYAPLVDDDQEMAGGLLLTAVNGPGFSADHPPVAHSHALAGAGIATGAPALGLPALSANGGPLLAALGLQTAAPALECPDLGQRHALVGAGLAAGRPVSAAPVLRQNHTLTSAGLRAGAPSPGKPVPGQTHRLAARGLRAGAPVLGRPAPPANTPPSRTLSLAREARLRCAAREDRRRPVVSEDRTYANSA